MNDRIELANLDGSRVELLKAPGDLETITLATIMQGLDRVPRWRGQTREPWTIGHHMVFAALIAERLGASPVEILAAALHDVEEAVTGIDVSTPLKRKLFVEHPCGHKERYVDFEDRLRVRCIAMLIDDERLVDVIRNALLKLFVKKADAIALTIEATLLISPELGAALGADRYAVKMIDDPEGVSLQEFDDIRRNPYPSALWLDRVKKQLETLAKAGKDMGR